MDWGHTGWLFNCRCLFLKNDVSYRPKAAVHNSHKITTHQIKSRHSKSYFYSHVFYLNRLRFIEQYYDSETGLHYNYFRDYDPSTGRYVQSDPIGLVGGLNTYGYVGGNPLLYSDSYGLCIGSILPCGYGVWEKANKEGPVIRDAAIEGTTTGLTAISMLYGVGLVPRVAKGYGLLSEAAILSDASIMTGFGLRNSAVAAYEASVCAVNNTIASGAALASSPVIVNNQQQILDFVNSLYPGAPAPNLYGLGGAGVNVLISPEESLR